MKVCPGCGGENEDTAIFCAACGDIIEWESSSPARSSPIDRGASRFQPPRHPPRRRSQRPPAGAAGPRHPPAPPAMPPRPLIARHRRRIPGAPTTGRAPIAAPAAEPAVDPRTGRGRGRGAPSRTSRTRRRRPEPEPEPEPEPAPCARRRADPPARRPEQPRADRRTAAGRTAGRTRPRRRRAPTPAAPASAAHVGIARRGDPDRRAVRAHRPGRRGLRANRDQIRRTGVTVAVVGEFKKGKSSLVNALVNAEVCPSDPVDATVAPIVVQPRRRARRHGRAQGRAEPPRSTSPRSPRFGSEAGNDGQPPRRHPHRHRRPAPAPGVGPGVHRHARRRRARVGRRRPEPGDPRAGRRRPVRHRLQPGADGPGDRLPRGRPPALPDHRVRDDQARPAPRRPTCSPTTTAATSPRPGSATSRC